MPYTKQQKAIGKQLRRLTAFEKRSRKKVVRTTGGFIGGCICHSEPLKCPMHKRIGP